MELSIESRCQIVTWKVRDFFQLPSEIGYSLDSPEFRFADDSYCLRLYPNGSESYNDEPWLELELVRLTFNFPERSASGRHGWRSRKETGEETDQYGSWEIIEHRSWFGKNRNTSFPGGTFTALCSMHLKEQNRARNPQFDEVETSDSEDNQNRLLGQSVVFSSRWCSSKMELSTVSPYQHVTWEIPDFFKLLSKNGYYLNSPDFLFAGDRYCFRFYPKGERNGDAPDTVLQLVRLTSTFPERNLLYKVGYKNGIYGRYIQYKDTLIDELVFCFSLSELEENKDRRVPRSNFYVACFMHLKEQDSAGIPQSEEAGNLRSEEKQERLPEKEFVNCAVQTEIANTVTDKENTKYEDWSSLDSKEKEFVNCAVQTEIASTVTDKENTKYEDWSSLDSKEKEFVNCAVQTEIANTVIDKENTKDEDWSSLDSKGVSLLSERMKELLIKGRDHDVKICVKEKEFPAHRSILSARSPVFAMMLAHDTKENNTGTISIEDCNPDIFDEFLLFVYSGRTENLTPSNALQLYYPADKYDFPVLKERCVNILKTSLSVSSICDVVLLATRHQEKELLEVATEFFAQNLKEILVTVNWQNFMSQNPVEANELYIKSMEILLLRK